MTEKKLKRSSDAMIAGVAAGVAEYFGLDVTLVRIIWAILTIFGGAGLIAYLICWILMPKA
jgi:phage shock protein PspC (stress-responsive transcriptional regulator)